MKSLSQWFELYGESHQNTKNVKIHKIAVPLIFFSVIGFIFSIPGILGDIILLMSVLATSIFYFMLNVRLGAFMSLYSVLGIAIANSLAQYVFIISLVVFIIAWVFQFVGHKIEGKKPSFLDDLSFLLIGPAWVFKDFLKLN